MMCVFVGFAKIFLGFLVESLLATERTEVIGLTLILGCASGGCGGNVHAADGIMYCSCHGYLLLLDIIITVIDFFNESHIT